MINKKVIMNTAQRVGFDLVGVVEAAALDEERNQFERWLLNGNNSTLEYLERNVEKRFDIRLLVEGARTVIVCAVSYLSPFSRGYDEGCNTKIASYALARDYHTTIKEMLHAMAEELKRYNPQLRYRAFTDSAPVAEKSLAVRAGLGWIGRQSLVVNPRLGTMFHLGELVIDDVVDEYDSPMKGGGCGSCRECVNHCPNSAILDNYTIDTRRCISCRTIEREGCNETITLDGWIFGCDACQSCCPFNRHAPLHTNKRFDSLFDPTAMDASTWRRMTNEEFMTLAGDTAMIRSGLERIKSNICDTRE
ncbi:MAG: tRNA epoxyqueuosine(34) reductase QueG [Alistipes sp.]|nr:tRNA epoxyqueuosine(34) reductase QueG [Alistipes sp.]